VLKVGVDAVQINAHSILLAAQSSYYSAALEWNERANEDAEKPVVISHPDIEVEVMRAILGFIYTGQIELHDENIDKVMEAAGYLLIPDLVNLCKKELWRFEKVEISKITDSVIVFIKLSETIAEKDRGCTSCNLTSMMSNENVFEMNTGPETKVSWSLLFRASEHGFNASAFHEYCDDKGPTITLIKVLAADGHTTSVAAAYNSDSWSSRKGIYPVSKAFIVGVNDQMSNLARDLEENSKFEGYSTVNYGTQGPTYELYAVKSFQGKIMIGDGTRIPSNVHNLNFLWSDGPINVVEYEVFRIVEE